MVVVQICSERQSLKNGRNQEISVNQDQPFFVLNVIDRKISVLLVPFTVLKTILLLRMSILIFSILRSTWICMCFSMWKHMYSSFLLQCSQGFMYISFLGVQWGRTCSKICPLHECEKWTLVARTGKITYFHGTEEKRFGLESNNACYPFWISEATISSG